MATQGNYYSGVGTTDFWRSGAGVLLPDGTTDTTDVIFHQGITNIGSAANATGKVGAATNPAKLNIENTTAGQACLALYQANNGATVTTKIELWNTNVVAGTVEYTNPSYTGVGGGNALVIGTALTSNAPTVFMTNGVERGRINAFGFFGVNTGATVNARLEVNNVTPNTSGVRLTQLLSTSPAVAGSAIGVTASGDICRISGGIKKVTQNLVVGANLITDNAGLLTPFDRIVQVRSSTGNEISVTVTLSTANTYTVTVGAAVTGAVLMSIS